MLRRRHQPNHQRLKRRQTLLNRRIRIRKARTLRKVKSVFGVILRNTNKLRKEVFCICRRQRIKTHCRQIPKIHTRRHIRRFDLLSHSRLNLHKRRFFACNLAPKLLQPHLRRFDLLYKRLNHDLLPCIRLL